MGSRRMPMRLPLRPSLSRDVVKLSRMRPTPRAVTGSSGSYPAITSKSLARSVTVRAIGPSDPFTEGQPAYTPARLTKPAGGRIPATQFHVDGRRIEANPSWPTATVQKFADTLAPEPPEEPPAVRSRS